jgi:hypothetical protein
MSQSSQCMGILLVGVIQIQQTSYDFTGAGSLAILLERRPRILYVRDLHSVA